MISQTETEPSRRTRRRPRPRTLILLGVGGLFVFLLVTGIRHARETSKKPAVKARSETVSVAKVTRGDIPVRLTELGTVTPLATVTVKSQISGYLVSVGFKEGEEVTKGTVLAQVDPRPYEAVLTQYEGNLLRDQALLKNARIDLNRYQRLVKLNSIAEQNLDTARASVGQYEGAVKTDQGLIAAEQLDLDYARITAPVDGRIGLRLVDRGNYVTPGDATGIAVVTEMKPMSVIFTIPQTALSAVLDGLKQGPLAVSARDGDGGRVLASGTVRTIDNQVDTTTGTVKLRAIFPNTDEALFPNAFVNVSLLVTTHRGVVVAPSDAVQSGSMGTYVFVVQPNDTVKTVPVSVGDSADGRTEITKGLQPGETVVLEGMGRLRDGAHVTIVPGS